MQVLAQTRARPSSGTRCPQGHSGALLVIPAVVVLPAEIDTGNAGEVGSQLRAALWPGTAVVIADMSATTFADSSAVGALLTARGAAAASDADLRLVIPAPKVTGALVRVMGGADISWLVGWLAAAGAYLLLQRPAVSARRASRHRPAPSPAPGRQPA
jgi:anti-anti-sigma regulatory factor